MSTAMAAAIEKARRWKADPVAFVRELFGVEPDAWQADVLRAFPTHQRIAMKACKGPGKTAVEAWLGWNFLATRPNCKVACTSITADNLRDNLWTELALWQNKSPLLKALFTWGKERIVANERPETWWCAARSFQQSADQGRQADTLAGLHADYILFMLDEVGAIPSSVLVAAEAALATDPDGLHCKIVIGGNPTNLEGPLYDAATKDRHLWHLTEVTGDPDDPKRSPRISVKWAREQIAKHGKDNPWVLVNVFGRFPPASINVLLGPNDVQGATGRALKDHEYSFAASVLGVDVARFGDARTVITRRQGRATWEPVVLRGAATQEIAARIVHECGLSHTDAVFIDDTGGWAAGVIDALRLGGIAPIPVNASGRPADGRYLNLRAECWFKMAEWTKGGGSLFPIDDYARELTAPTYMFHGGKLQLESKDQVSARIGASPDVADALSLTFAQDVVRGAGIGRPLAAALRENPANVVTEFDPYA
jgi:phage terminase large subunit